MCAMLLLKIAYIECFTTTLDREDSLVQWISLNAQTLLRQGSPGFNPHRIPNCDTSFFSVNFSPRCYACVHYVHYVNQYPLNANIIISYVFLLSTSLHNVFTTCTSTLGTP